MGTVSLEVKSGVLLDNRRFQQQGHPHLLPLHSLLQNPPLSHLLSCLRRFTEFRGLASHSTYPRFFWHTKRAVYRTRPSAFNNGKRHVIQRQGIMANFVFAQGEPMRALWVTAGTCNQSPWSTTKRYLSNNRIEHLQKSGCQSDDMS